MDKTALGLSPFPTVEGGNVTYFGGWREFLHFSVRPEARGGNLGMTADDDDDYDGDGPDNGLAQFTLVQYGNGDPKLPYFMPKSYSSAFHSFNIPEF